MKKKIVLLSMVLFLAAAAASLYWFIQNRDEDSPHVITADEAIAITQEMLDEKSLETIINADSPKVEEVFFDSDLHICLIDPQDDLIGRGLYRIIYNTTMDGLLGPIVFYVDRAEAKIVGMDYRA